MAKISSECFEVATGTIPIRDNSDIFITTSTGGVIRIEILTDKIRIFTINGTRCDIISLRDMVCYEFITKKGMN